jgi:surface protein
MDWLFYNCSNLTSLNLSSFDMTKVQSASDMIDSCPKLSTINTPRNVKVSVTLPNGTWYDTSGNIYTKLPMNKSTSIKLSTTKPAAGSGNGSGTGSGGTNGGSSGSTGGGSSAVDSGSSAALAANAAISDDNPVTKITVSKSAPKTGTITIDNPNPTIDLGSQITATTKNKTTVSNLGSSVTWTSNKPSVATVDANGVVTLKSAGTAKITVKSTDKKAKKTTITIKVKQAVMGIDITTKNGQALTVEAGKSLALKANLTPAKPSNKKLIWTIDSSDPKIKINKSNGKVTVKKGATPGTYTVTARAADNFGAVSTQTITVQ